MATKKKARPGVQRSDTQAELVAQLVEQHCYPDRQRFRELTARIDGGDVEAVGELLELCEHLMHQRADLQRRVDEWEGRETMACAVLGNRDRSKDANTREALAWFLTGAPPKKTRSPANAGRLMLRDYRSLLDGTMLPALPTEFAGVSKLRRAWAAIDRVTELHAVKTAQACLKALRRAANNLPRNDRPYLPGDPIEYK